MTFSPSCPDCGSSQRIGIEISELYDGVLFWRCEDCHTSYHRFAADHFLYQRATPFILARELAKTPEPPSPPEVLTARVAELESALDVRHSSAAIYDAITLEPESPVTSQLATPHPSETAK